MKFNTIKIIEDNRKSKISVILNGHADTEFPFTEATKKESILWAKEQAFDIICLKLRNCEEVSSVTYDVWPTI